MPGDKDLWTLLGLPPDTPVDKLRNTYEKHMADATRSQNYVRALELSRAFDALGKTDRHAVYSGTPRSAPAAFPERSRRTARAQRRESRPAVPGRSTRRARSRRVRQRFLVALIVIPLVGFGFYEFGLKDNQNLHPPSFPRHQVPVFTETAVVQPQLTVVPIMTVTVTQPVAVPS